jgi:AcrR family transcriptional regulator
VATRLFARLGYNATTTAAIAKAARVTEPILYRHFKSKQAMFVAIVRQMSEQTLQFWQARLGDRCKDIMDKPTHRPMHEVSVVDGASHGVALQAATTTSIGDSGREERGTRTGLAKAAAPRRRAG